MGDDKEKEISEGLIRKNSLNDRPTTERPNIKPTPQKPQGTPTDQKPPSNAKEGK
jgi:hypothetical protein